MTTRMRAWMLAPALLMVAGCAPPGTYSKVRNSVRDVVERQLGPADKYDVEISHDSLSSLRAGKISEVKVHGVNVRTRAGITLDDIYLTADDVVVDRNAKRVKSARDASFSATLGESAIASLLGKAKLIADPTVQITPEGVSVKGKYTAGPAPVNIAATGSVRVSGPTTIEFLPKSATVGGIPMPLAMIGSRISPSLDFSNIYEPLVIQGVSLEQGKAVLTGTLDWSKIP